MAIRPGQWTIEWWDSGIHLCDKNATISGLDITPNPLDGKITGQDLCKWLKNPLPNPELENPLFYFGFSLYWYEIALGD